VTLRVGQIIGENSDGPLGREVMQILPVHLGSRDVVLAVRNLATIWEA
jgi:hypothetical protein